MTFAEGVVYAKALRKRAQGFWLNPEATGQLGEKALEAARAAVRQRGGYRSSKPAGGSITRRPAPPPACPRTRACTWP